MKAVTHPGIFGPKYHIARDSTQDANSAAAQPSTTAVSTSYVLTHKTVATMAAVISVVGFIVLSVFAFWKYRTAKRQKTRNAPSLAGKVTVETKQHYASEKHIDLENVSVYMEKPQKAVITPNSLDTQVGWVPQFQPNRPYGVADKVPVPEPLVAGKSKVKPYPFQTSVEPLQDTSIRLTRSPPPSYYGGGESQSPRFIPIPPSPPVPATQPPTPPTPPANRKTKMSFTSLSEEAPLPTPSPRSESFAPQDIILPTDRQSTDMSNDQLAKEQRLPRLMSVVTTFSPSLGDELAIKLGDTVRMLEEYRDGWCLVQRVGRVDAPRGAVPRFCLQERRGVIPIAPARKFSTGSLNSFNSSR